MPARPARLKRVVAADDVTGPECSNLARAEERSHRFVGRTACCFQALCLTDKIPERVLTRPRLGKTLSVPRICHVVRSVRNPAVYCNLVKDKVVLESATSSSAAKAKDSVLPENSTAKRETDPLVLDRQVQQDTLHDLACCRCCPSISAVITTPNHNFGNL